MGIIGSLEKSAKPGAYQTKNYLSAERRILQIGNWVIIFEKYRHSSPLRQIYDPFRHGDVILMGKRDIADHKEIT